jgi:hypothetical protein
MEYYTTKIQIHERVIKDVFKNIKEDSKMLVFGLGYDSKMWYEGCNKNVFFVENNDKYIELNIKKIPLDNIIKYDYKTTCASSEHLTDNEITGFIIPQKIEERGPYDIIIIDGPEGYTPEKPGRLIPIYWATKLTKPGTLIYIDDSKRPLENRCIQKYFADYEKTYFDEREGTTKIFITHNI